MRDQSLRGHIQNLEQQGELIRVTTETDPHTNVSAIGWKTSPWVCSTTWKMPKAS